MWVRFKAAPSRQIAIVAGSTLRPSARPAGQPIERARVDIFLASQEACSVTGEVYGATGGNGTA